MAINIHTVRNDLEERGWILLSDTYKNLQTPLQMKCPNKHDVMINYDSWRKYHTCDQCMTGKEGMVKKTVPSKTNKTRVLAVDAATKTTGFAVFDAEDLVYYNHINVTGDNAFSRMRKIKLWLMDFIVEHQIDYIALEDIFQESDFKSFDVFKKLANLQGILIETLLALNKKYFLVMPSEWRKTCVITEKKREIVKKRAIEKVIDWYNISVTEDEAEAICLGKHVTKTYWAQLGI